MRYLKVFSPEAPLYLGTPYIQAWGAVLAELTLQHLLTPKEPKTERQQVLYDMLNDVNTQAYSTLILQGVNPTDEMVADAAGELLVLRITSRQ